MGLRERLARLETLLEGEVIEIPQRDGTVARFPESAGREAFVNLMASFAPKVASSEEFWFKIVV